MNVLKSTWAHLQKIHTSRGAQWLTAIVVFLFFSWFYMGPSLTSCNSATSAFNSDTTGGMAWYQWASGNQLSWGYTAKSNYPTGEALYRPQFITSEVFTTPYRIASAVTSPVCGVNIMILGGYMTSALIMFGLIIWLTKRFSIALFAGYAAAYIPFHQLKAQTHIVYMYGSVFIGILWAYLWYLNKPRWQRLIPFIVMVAAGVYIDGYFILLSGMLTLGLLIAIFFQNSLNATAKKGLLAFTFNAKQFWANCKLYIKHLLIALLGLILLLIPVIYRQLSSGNEIRQSLSAARGNIKLEAVTYGARLTEYVLPAYNNALLPTSYSRWRLNHQHYSNPSEDTLYIGLTVLTLAAVSLLYWLRKDERKEILVKNLTYGRVVAATTIALLLCFAFSLPSSFTLYGHRFLTPVAVLIELTANWRVFSRFVIVISPLCVVLASLALWRISNRLSYRKFLALWAVCFTVLFLEFLPKPLQPHGDYNTQTPKVYKVLKQDKSIQTIAEYPVTNLLYVPSVFSFQPIHGKNVINANDSGIALSPLNMTTMGIGDAQTQAVLKARSVQVVTSYGTDFTGVPNLSPYIAEDASTKAVGLPSIYSYRLSRAITPARVALARDTGFDYPWVGTDFRAHHQLASTGTLRVVDAKGSNKKVTNTVSIRFTAKSISGAPTGLTLSQNGKQVWAGIVGEPTEVSVSIKGGDKIKVQVSEPVDLTDFSANVQ